MLRFAALQILQPYRVSPIFKTGNIHDPSNYRPISVLPICMTIFEKLVHEQLYNYMSSDDLLCNQQSGFRPNQSTVTTLIDVTYFLFKNMDSRQLTGVVYLDLKKAFDTVDTSILLSKLEMYGIRYNELRWFNNYLTGCSQVVSVNGAISDSRDIDVGVPQGSVLGPLLFIVLLMISLLWLTNTILLSMQMTQRFFLQ